MEFIVAVMELTPGLIVGLIVLGLFLGIFTTIGGIGGGPLFMPIFLLILMYEKNLAKGTSILLVFLGSGIATFHHYRNKKTHLLSMFVLSLVASLGSLTTFLLESNLKIDTGLFYFLFGVFELFIALRMLFKGIKAYITDKNNEKVESKPESGEEAADPEEKKTQRRHIHNTSINIIQNPKMVWKAFPLFFLAGSLATFLGIGGGPLTTPILYEIMNFPICNATAGSSTIIFFNSIVNLIMYGMRGEIDWVVGGITGVGIMVGAYIGAKISSKVPRWATLTLLAALLVFAGIKMITG